MLLVELRVELRRKGRVSSVRRGGEQGRLTSVLNILMISELSLLTIVSALLSQRTGTVNLQRSSNQPSPLAFRRFGPCSPAIVLRVGLEVELTDELGVVKRVGDDALEAVVGSDLALGSGVRAILAADRRVETLGDGRRWTVGWQRGELVSEKPSAERRTRGEPTHPSAPMKG